MKFAEDRWRRWCGKALAVNHLDVVAGRVVELLGLDADGRRSSLVTLALPAPRGDLVDASWAVPVCRGDGDVETRNSEPPVNSMPRLRPRTGRPVRASARPTTGWHTRAGCGR